MTRTTRAAWAMNLLAPLMVPAYAAAQAMPTLTTLHYFTGYPDDGANPLGGVAINRDGVIYGTTSYGGAYGPSYYGGFGAVFFLVPPATPGGSWTELLYNIPAAIGVRPYAGATLGPNGMVYATTQHGGGAAFQMVPPATAGGEWAESVISAPGPVILYPYGPLAIGPGGVLYGTSYEGASTFDGSGDVFSLTPPASPGGAWTTASIWDFFNRASFPPDGYYPESGVTVGAGGVLYGTTTQSAPGGSMGGPGTVFLLTPPVSPGGPWTEQILYWFGAAPGPISPGNAGVAIGRGGVLYGTTLYGGTGFPCACGTVYALTPPARPGGAWTETTLYSFSGGSDGASPNGGVAIGPGGVLYGTTTSGGDSTACSGGCGTVFSLTPPASPGGAWTETVLHSFNFTDGSNPNAGVTIGKDGALYGTTMEGGIGSHCYGPLLQPVSGCGTVFQLR